ncbi:MAG: uroporphyrinogen-III C-methyltransferase [Gammaproteobacteria bacterium]
MSKANKEQQESTGSAVESDDIHGAVSDTEAIVVDEVAAQSSGGGAAFWLALLSLLLSAALGGAAYYFWTLQQQVQQTQSKLQSGQDTLLSNVNSRMSEVGSTVSQIRTGFDEMKMGDQDVFEQFEQRLNHLNTQQQGQTEQVASLSSLVSRGTQEWSLAEITYLTRLANQRVQLHRDTGSAMIALKNADEQLANLADPRSTAVREQLARDMASLKSVLSVDMTGMVSTLGALLEGVGQLPVKNNHLKPASVNASEASVSDKTEVTALDWRSAEAWKAIPGVMWNAIRELVTLRELDAPVAPMLPADKEYFLRQNLRLQFEATRLALLREDTDFYLQSLTNAKEWTRQYFNEEDPRVVASLESLDELLSVNIKPEMPDISGSLRALQQYKDLAR